MGDTNEIIIKYMLLIFFVNKFHTRYTLNNKLYANKSRKLQLKIQT